MHEGPDKTKAKARNADNQPQRRLPKQFLDQLDDVIREWGGSDAVKGPDGLMKALTAALVERALDGELTHHLDYEPGEDPPEGQTNRRNGSTTKTVRTHRGPVQINVPRDRDASFEPRIIPKHQRQFDGFDDQILSLYARGASTRDIQAHLQEVYGTDVGPDFVTRVTDSVLEDVHAWQSRPLEAMYPVVYLDALVVKVRDTGVVQNKSVYFAVGVTPDGEKDVLGMWIQSTEGASFWLSILNELKQRGVQDVLVICADGLKGLPSAVEAAFPRAIFQTCIVHMIRQSTRYVPWSQRKRVCAKLRSVYGAANAEHAAQALDEFEAEYGAQFPTVVKTWRSRWDEITPFLSFPAEIRRAIYTTNAIEALNRHVRKGLKTRGHLPNDQAVLKLVYLNVRTARRWGNPPAYWPKARAQFMLMFEGRWPP